MMLIELDFRRCRRYGDNGAKTPTMSGCLRDHNDLANLDPLGRHKTPREITDQHIALLRQIIERHPENETGPFKVRPPSTQKTSIPIFPTQRFYSLLSANSPTTTVLPRAALLMPEAPDSVDSRTLLREARRSLLVDLTTLVDH